MTATKLGGWVLVLALAGCEQEGATKGSETDTNATPASGATATTTATTTATPSAPAPPPQADPSRLKLSGKSVQGGLMKAQIDPKTRGIEFPGHRVVISPEGVFLIAFYRNAPPKEKLTITFPDGAVLEHEFEIEQRTFPDDRIDGLPERWVKLDPTTRKKLRSTNARIDEIRMAYTKEAHYEEGFIWPAEGRITSRYGQKRYLNGIDSGIHWGVDIAVPVGTPVKAPAGGRVTFAEPGVPLAGNTVVIDHGHGLSSTLIHLDRIAVKVGQEVKQGDVVATVGMTGRTNGPHLDWRMNLFEIRIDPELVAPPMPGAE